MEIIICSSLVSTLVTRRAFNPSCLLINDSMITWFSFPFSGLFGDNHERILGSRCPFLFPLSTQMTSTPITLFGQEPIFPSRCMTYRLSDLQVLSPTQVFLTTGACG